MVSLTNRALVSFISDDNYSGLQHLLDNRRVVVDDRDEVGSYNHLTIGYHYGAKHIKKHIRGHY